MDRRERLRRLALETIDLAKDPYYMRNHLGQIECRLCLTLHPNEGNYLAHTQVGSNAKGEVSTRPQGSTFRNSACCLIHCSVHEHVHPCKSLMMHDVCMH